MPVARALVAGGLPVIELTLRTPAALDAIRAIADEVPEILVGAGTIAHAGPGQAGADAGAQFLVSPGATPALLGAMEDTGLPFLPGTATVSEVLAVLEAGLTEMKFFPAEASGGAAYLGSIACPVPAARFCPTGGITAATAGDYLRAAERRLRRRLLAHPARRASPRATGRGSSGWPPRPRRWADPAYSIDPVPPVGRSRVQGGGGLGVGGLRARRVHDLTLGPPQRKGRPAMRHGSARHDARVGGVVRTGRPSGEIDPVRRRAGPLRSRDRGFPDRDRTTPRLTSPILTASSEEHPCCDWTTTGSGTAGSPTTATSTTCSSSRPRARSGTPGSGTPRRPSATRPRRTSSLGRTPTRCVPHPEGWDDLAIWTGSVVQGDDGDWRMYYTAINTRGHELRDQRVGVVESDDLMTWCRVKDAPVARRSTPAGTSRSTRTPTASETWRDPLVLRDPDGDGWHMLVAARARRRREATTTACSPTPAAPTCDHWEIGPPVCEPGAGFGQLEVRRSR